MTTSFMAIVENGQLRPTSSVSLEEGATVEVTVRSSPGTANPASAAAALARIASLPTSGGDPLTSLNHDEVLYGAEQGS